MVRGPVTTLWLCLLLSPALGYEHFQKEIPNGDRVSDPVLANVLWSGVGHLNAKGGGDRNVFGLDFNANGNVNIVLYCTFTFMRVTGKNIITYVSRVSYKHTNTKQFCK